MNSAERVLTALNGGIPDKIPMVELAIDTAVMEKIMPGSTWLDFYENFDIDGVTVFYDIDYEDVGADLKRDYFGVVRNFKEMQGFFPTPIEPLIKPEMDAMEFLDTYKMPDPKDPKNLESLRQAIERLKGKKAVFFLMHSSLIYPIFIRGFENYLMDYYLNSDFAKRLSEMVTDFFIELEKQAIEMGADAIVEAEDYAGNYGLWMSVDTLKEFVIPGLRRTIKVAKESNIPFIKHCDGDLWPILDLLRDEGIDCLNPVEPAAGMDIGLVKQKYGKEVSLWGNIDCANLMTFGSPADVEKATIECIKKAAHVGGHILSSSNTIHSAVPVENYMAMINTTRKYGNYPLNL